MTRKRKKAKRNFNTKPASDRIFYRKPSVMFFEFLWSAPGLVISILLFGWSVAFITIFGG